MKTIKIRSSVFETNSSSTHSISIDTSCEGVMDMLKLDADNNIRLTYRAFDVDENITNAHDKAVYLLLFLMSYYNNEIDKREDMLEAIQKQTGCEKIFLDNLDINFEYIDTYSTYDFKELFYDDSVEKIRQFIFNSNHILKIIAHD